MTSLTHDEVAKLRMPEGWQLVSVRADEGYSYWDARPIDPDPRLDYTRPGTAINAELVANGHLPPAVLDAVWAAVEGKKSDIEVVLDWVSAHPFERSFKLTHFDCDGEMRHAFEIALYEGASDDDSDDALGFCEFFDTREEAFRAAREWIERQS